MKKIPNKIWIPIVLVGLLFGGYLYLNKENVIVRVETASTGEKVVKVHEENQKVDSEFPMSMSENSVQQAIHKMSHQKVQSKKKWGALPLTTERVKRLIQVVEANEKEYENADLYLRILRSWDKGDFDNVVIAHNSIWSLQGGTVGKAYSAASPEEEMKFIEENFDVK
ncbi:DUF6241 domain-containing protein [Neobacillus drentensis]|uniref:DUF6241 domain-containing protein n=1 Tax=Neobacillus drentensis TaxID=220684 RepID=UPI00285963A9|nr:DUF6241 domain-containing protein [Neobacillus drentensis]MDR7239700.1 hypothetical protein [Neobacillus drentensis]